MKTMSRLFLATMVAMIAMFCCVQANAKTTVIRGNSSMMSANAVGWTLFGTDIKVTNYSSLSVYTWIPSINSPKELLTPGETLTFHTDQTYFGLNTYAEYYGYPNSTYMLYIPNGFEFKIFNPDFYYAKSKVTGNFKVNAEVSK